MEPTLLALDVGGTEIKAALFNPEGVELAAGTTATPRTAQDPAGAVLDAAARLARTLQGPPPAAVGLLIPGIVDEETGVGIRSANLGWHSYPFRDRAAALFGVPIGFGHDVGKAGEAEVASDPASASGDTAVVVIGTGIAAVLFDAGRRVRGSGFAGELGHLAVPHRGAWNPLESVASAAAIGRSFAHRTGGPRGGSREVFEAAGYPGSEHAEVAQEVIAEACDALAFAFLQVSMLLGTERFILTGGLARAGEALRGPVADRLDAAASFRRTSVSLGRLGARAGLVGALQCARQAMHASRGAT